MVVTVLLALLGPGDACGEPPAAATVQPAIAVESLHAKNPWVEPARDVLVSACGSCHRPGLPTSNKGALAVFNLHEPVWYKTMTNDQLRGMRRRIEASSSLDDGDKKAIASFVACEVDGMCEGTDAKEIAE